MRAVSVKSMFRTKRITFLLRILEFRMARYWSKKLLDCSDEAMSGLLCS